MALDGDTKAVLLAAALMFLMALLLGVWKYRQITSSSEASAHPYVDIAHRAALLYSFALLLVATFVELSGWGTAVNLVAAVAMAFYFFAAVVGYALHGWRRDTDNQFRDPVSGHTPLHDQPDRRRDWRLDRADRRFSRWSDLLSRGGRPAGARWQSRP